MQVHAETAPRYLAGLALIRRYFPECVSRARRLPAGAEILLEGEVPEYALWLVDGWVSLYKQMDDGRRQTLDVLLPADLITSPRLRGQPAPFGVITLTEAKVAHLPFRRIEELRRTDTDFMAALDALERHATTRCAERMLRLGQASAEEIVAFLILEFCVRLSSGAQSDSARFHLPISQKDMGEIVGLTNVHVCRMMRRLVGADMIEIDGDFIRVTNVHRLARFCGIDLDLYSQQIAAGMATGDRMQSGPDRTTVGPRAGGHGPATGNGDAIHPESLVKELPFRSSRCGFSRPCRYRAGPHRIRRC